MKGNQNYGCGVIVAFVAIVVIGLLMVSASGFGDVVTGVLQVVP